VRVSIVSETYFPEINGVSRALANLVRFLHAQGDTLQLLVPRYPAPLEDILPGMDVNTFASLPLPLYREVRMPLARPRAVAERLRQFRPDLLHIATEGTLGHCALRIARRRGIPVATSYHTNFAAYSRSYFLACLEPLIWRYLRRFHNAAGVTLCPTESIAVELRRRGFRRVGIWSRGVDSMRFDPRKRDANVRAQWGIGDREIVALYAGRLANEKNLNLLLDAFEMLTATPATSASVRPRLMLVGDGPARARLQRRAGPGTVFTGYQRGEDLAKLYATAEFFVFPSLTETFGNVILEAMASGLPVIAFNVPGPKDVIRSGTTGRIVETVSSRALADAMADLLHAPDRRRAMGRAAREYAVRQEWSAVNHPVRETYRKLLLMRADQSPGSGIAGVPT